MKKLAICLFDDKAPKMLRILHNYIDNSGLKSRYKIEDKDITEFDYSYQDELIEEDEDYQRIMKEALRSKLESLNLNESDVLIVLIDYELYVGVNYAKRNDFLHEETFRAVVEKVKGTNLNTFIFFYTFVKENELFNYMLREKDNFKSEMGENNNIRIFKKGLRMVDDRPAYYNNQFDMIFQAVSEEGEDLWL